MAVKYAVIIKHVNLAFKIILLIFLAYVLNVLVIVDNALILQFVYLANRAII